MLANGAEMMPRTPPRNSSGNSKEIAQSANKLEKIEKTDNENRMKKPSSRKSGHENLSHPSMKTGQKKPETGKSFPGNGKHESKEKEKSQTGLA